MVVAVNGNRCVRLFSSIYELVVTTLRNWPKCVERSSSSGMS